ncbi:MAG: MmgE/PrpD family protein [Deltaproteobacteria bacterium]|nr:MmgE/PrpD family protein [Deltaproteobacteria bacterium]
MSGKTLAERIAAWGLDLKFKDISNDAVHEAKRRVIDSFACLLGGHNSPPAHAARTVAPQSMVTERGGGATIIGVDHPTTPDFAAFANGIMVRYLDYNDTYLSKEPAHPSDNIPAAIAASEVIGRSGEDLITAIVAAYELQCALCDAASLRARGWDHVTYGAFSATIAASMLLGLSKDETAHALNIAGTASPALRQTRAGELSMWKGCAFANAARNAVFAALLARGGITGPAPVFEGEFGFFNLVSGPFELKDLASKKDDRYRITKTYIKYYPAEYHSQSAIGAAIELSREIEDASDIESVTVKTFRAGYEIIGSGKERWRPKTRETADHSLPFCVAAALLDGNINLSTFTDRLNDEKLLGLVDKVKVEVDGDLDRLYPEAIPNRIEVRLKSGGYLTKEIIYPKGHPRNPLTDVEVEEKFRNLGQWYFTNKETDSVLEFLWRLEEMKDTREMLRLFAKGRRVAR